MEQLYLLQLSIKLVIWIQICSVFSSKLFALGSFERCSMSIFIFIEILDSNVLNELLSRAVSKDDNEF